MKTKKHWKLLNNVKYHLNQPLIVFVDQKADYLSNNRLINFPTH
jgi:hypothetical protein